MGDNKRFRAGVLFGDEVKELLDYAKANEFALPAVNCIGTNTVNATLAAAREVNSPMMIQFSNGGAQFFIGKGVSKDKQLGPVLGGIAGAHYVDAAAKAYGVPVAPEHRSLCEEAAAVGRWPVRRERGAIREDRQAAL